MSGNGRGLFLDLDGTLADSVPALRQAYYDTLAEFGVQGSDAEFDRCNGLPLVRVIDELRSAHRIEPDAQEILRVLAPGILRAYAECDPRAGAQELLTGAAERGLRIAIVTSSVEELTRRWLVRHDLESFVDCVVDSVAVSRGKPAPDPYLRALTETGCEAGLSLAVEDSRAGAESAVAAGIGTVLVGALPPPDAGWPELRGAVTELDEVLELLAT